MEILVRKIRLPLDQNPRAYRPPEVLVNQIKELGVLTPPLVYFEEKNGYYWASNGWQRVTAARKLGILKIMCKVYESKFLAQAASIAEDTTTPETTLQKYKRFHALYQAGIEDGMSVSESLEECMRLSGIRTQSSAQMRIDIFKLPPIFLSLMKDKANRTDPEWNRLEKILPSIRRYGKKLSLTVAASIANNFEDRNDNYKLGVGILCLKSVKAKHSHEFIKMVVDNPETSPLILHEEYMERNTEELVLKKIVSKEFLDKINRKCMSTHKTLNEIFWEFLEELLQDKKKEGLNDVGLKESYFDVGKYRVIIAPTVSIEGTPSIFYTVWEVKERAWNSNVKLPDYLKSFLENLTIQVIKSIEKAALATSKS